jgi:hypothetical protein
MFDVIAPKGPLEPFVAMAKRLGLTGFVVLNAGVLPESEFPLLAGVRVTHPTPPRPSVVRFGGAERHLLAHLDVVLDAETLFSHDGLHSRKSGLNHVLAEEAARRNVAIGLDVGLLRGPRGALMMGRHAQNALLCKKAGALLVLLTLASTPYELRGPREVGAYLSLLGLTGAQVKASLSYFDARVERRLPR